MQQNSSYKKIKCLYKGYSSKVHLVEWIDENDKPNKPKKFSALKRYYRKASDPVRLEDYIEYTLLSQFKHANIVQLERAFIEKFTYKQYICLSMEYMAPLNEAIKHIQRSHLSIIKQIIQALDYLHKNNIIHRDIKPSNILINLEGKVKVGDFGISRQQSHDMSSATCTKNYRAPELFFGCRDYDTSIDIWSLGCTFVELLTGRILFDGQTEIEIMSQLAEIIGTPSEDNWPGVSLLPNFLEFRSNQPPTLKMLLQKVPAEIQGLIESMLKLNPKSRVTAEKWKKSIKNLFMRLKPFQREIEKNDLYKLKRKIKIKFQSYFMNYQLKSTYNTPQFNRIKPHHKHGNSVPLFQSNTDQSQLSQSTNAGLNVLRKFDFFNDPFTVPEQRVRVSIKTEMFEDSLEEMVHNSKTDRHSDKKFGEGFSSLREIRKVSFNDLVTAQKSDGNVEEERLKTTNGQRKSYFSKFHNIK